MNDFNTVNEIDTVGGLEVHIARSRRSFLARGAATIAAVAAGTGLVGLGRANAATQVTTIQIPRLGLNKSVYSGTASATLALGGFGHWLGTAQPGRNGNCMLFAHRTSAGAPLRNVHTMVVGDAITMAGKTYRVTAKSVVLVSQISTAVNWNPGRRPGLTLVSCARPDGLPTSLTHRIIIHAVA